MTPLSTPRIGFHLGWLGFAGILAYGLGLGEGFPPVDAGPTAFKATAVGATAWLMACWWMTEALPLAATSLVPLVAFPVLGVASPKDVSTQYFGPFIVLLMAGFMLANAVERWGLHRRVALAVLLRVGTSPARLLAGFMATTAGISMWISNTATALLMLPIATAVSAHVMSSNTARRGGFDCALLLGVAYAASIGGLATPIGTPPNLIFLAQYAALPETTPPSFLAWMLMALPITVFLLAAAYGWLYYAVAGNPATATAAPAEASDAADTRADLLSHRRALGPMTTAERRVAAVFALTALAWIFRADLHLGSVHIPGWQSALGFGAASWDDGTVAALAVITLFLIPARAPHPEAKAMLLDWETATRIPWGLLLLFGGGLALSHGFGTSGLSAAIGDVLANIMHWPPFWLVLAVSTCMIFLTEVTSNTATASVLLPILAATAHRAGLDPATLMVPATLCVSCAFMLPVATAPNAIVFGTGRVSIGAMARAGLFLNIVGAIGIALWMHYAGTALLR